MITSWTTREGTAPANDPRLLAPVRVRVLRAFHVGARRVEPGDCIVLDRATAESMAALHRVEIIQ